MEKNNAKAILVTWPLGSGKTTLINNLIPNFWEKTTLIVNDIWTINIDSNRLETKNKISLEQGCVCCQDFNSFETAIKNLRQDGAEVIIEPSWIAEAWQIKKSLEKNGFNVTTIVLWDWVHHKERSVEEKEIEKNQIKAADLIALSWKWTKQEQENFLKFLWEINKEAKIIDLLSTENQENISNEYSKFYENLWNELKKLNIKEETKKTVFSVNKATFQIIWNKNLLQNNKNHRNHSLQVFSKELNISKETILNLLKLLWNKIVRAKWILWNWQEFDVVHSSVNFWNKLNRSWFFNIISTKNLFDLLDEIENYENKKEIENLKNILINWEEMNETEVLKNFWEEFIDFSLSDFKIKKLVSQYFEYVDMEEKIQELSKNLKSPEDNAKITKLQIEQKNLWEAMKYDNPFIWVKYKIDAYKWNPESEIKTIWDFVAHCHKSPTYICGKRFHFLNKILQEKYWIDLFKVNQEDLMEDFLNKWEIEEISKDKNLMNSWLNYEYFNENNRVAKWENYKK